MGEHAIDVHEVAAIANEVDTIIKGVDNNKEKDDEEEKEDNNTKQDNNIKEEEKER